MTLKIVSLFWMCPIRMDYLLLPNLGIIEFMSYVECKGCVTISKCSEIHIIQKKQR